jgi:hypothetical protein
MGMIVRCMVTEALPWYSQAYQWLVRYPLAFIASFGLLLVAVIAMFFGMGDRFNVGGLIGKLFGRETKMPPDLEVKVNSIPEDRSTPVGEADDLGYTQQEVVVKDRSKNPFRDREVIKIQTPTGEEKVLPLPKGVKDTDVDMVIFTEPSQVEIRVISGPKKASPELMDKLNSRESK